MKIIFISEVSSIHAARWINQFKDLDWDIHIFQGIARNNGVCPEFKVGSLYIPFEAPSPNGLVTNLTLPKRFPLQGKLFRVIKRKSYGYQQKLEFDLAESLAELIKKVKPDFLHSLGLNINWQNMMLSVYHARGLLGGLEIPWIYSSWGADLMHYAKLSSAHGDEVMAILQLCDYYISECKRDADLARKNGFRGELLGFLPAFGGVTWKPEEFCAKGAPSSRRTILLKGRDISGGDPQGRAMSVMKAFSLCEDALKGYRIVICHAAPNVINEAAVLRSTTNLDISIIPHLNYESWLRIMGAARILVAATVTDGLPSTLVEAMSLGALPVHSGLSSIQEWIEDSKNGLLIPPENPEAIAEALRRALVDDGLVDRAAIINQAIVEEKLSDRVVKSKAIEMYKHVVEKGRTI